MGMPGWPYSPELSRWPGPGMQPQLVIPLMPAGGWAMAGMGIVWPWDYNRPPS